MKPISTRKWKKFLKSRGLKKIRTHGDHEIWDNPENPLIRCVTIIPSEKDVPLLHMHTTLETLGISKAEFMLLIKSIK